MVQMSSSLSPYRLRKARQIYNLFTSFSAFSFTMLSGNVITLYALRLGVSSTMIGILNAFTFLSFFFMPVGKRLVMRFPIVKVFGVAWFLRYASMILILPAPFFAARGRVDVALALMVVSVFSFHMFRGVGMISNNPILNALAEGPGRGSYVVQIQVVNSAMSLIGTISLALLLGRNPPLGLYGLFMTAGIATGIISSLMIFKLPEPSESSEPGNANFFATITRNFSDPYFRLFIAVFFFVSFVSATARTFAVVYSRDAYLQSDGDVALFSFFGSLGSLAIGLVSRLLVDRIGAKPLYIVYTAVSALSMAPAVVSPGFGVAAFTAIFLSLFHFALNFGFSGAEGVAQNYFFGLVKPADLLDLGILYYFVFGAAGAAGSFFGGVSLDLLAAAGLPAVPSYRLFFGALVLLLLLSLFMQRDLVRLGALPLRGALGVIFSFKDLRAITLLNRLDKTRNPQEETLLLEALHDVPSSVGAEGLLDRVHSPRLAVRLEAIRAIEALPKLSPEIEAALVSDVEQNPYTTAYISARVLGMSGSFKKCVPLLRNAVSSDDYMLAGEAMLALARRGDKKSVPLIEERVRTSRNPRLLIMGVSALEQFAEQASLSCLVDVLRQESPPPYLRDEVILSMAGILGILDGFYPAYTRFLGDQSLGTTLALDEIEAAVERYPLKRRKRDKTGDRKLGTAERVAQLREAVPAFVDNAQGAPLSVWIQDRISSSSAVSEPLFAEAALDADLACYERFRFLIGYWAATLLESELKH